MTEARKSPWPESSDRIERSIEIRAPLARVWRALADAEEFGAWFGVELAGQAFVAGGSVRGRITHPGYEHLVFNAQIERVELGHEVVGTVGLDVDDHELLLRRRAHGPRPERVGEVGNQS